MKLLICLTAIMLGIWPHFGEAFRFWRSREEIRHDDLVAGRAAMEDELFSMAQRHFEEALQRSTTLDEELEVAAELARSHRRSGDLEDAVRVLDRYADDAPGSGFYAEYLCEKAYLHFDLGSYRAALSALTTEVDEINDRTRSAKLRLLPKVYLKLGERDRALHVYEMFHEDFPAAPEAPANLLEWAAALSQTARLDDAVDKLRLVSRNYPGTRFAWMARVWEPQMLMRRGDWDEALEILSAIVASAEAPDDIKAEAYFYLARISERNEEIDEAVQYLKNIEQLNISSDSLHQGRIFMARLLFDSGRESEGLELIHESMRATPQDPMVSDTHLEMANLLFDRGKYKEALREYRYHIESIDDPSGYAQALLGKAWSLYETEDYIGSAEAFQRAANALEEPRLREEALHKAGDAYLRARRYDSALESFSKAIDAFDAGNYRPQSIYQMADVLRLLERLDEAQALLVQLRADYPGTQLAEQSWIRSARNEEERFDWQAAIDIYTEIIESEGDSKLARQARHDRGIIFYRLSQFAKALEDFDSLAVTDDDAPYVQRAFFMRGWCYYLIGEEERALEICKEFLNRYPDSHWGEDVNFWISNFYFNKAMFEEAEKRFSEMAAKYPDGRMTDSALLWAAHSSLKQREYVRAIEYLGRLVEKFPESGRINEARFAQGDALAALGRFSEAILAFEEIVKNSDPDSPAGYFAVRAWGRIGDCNFTLASDNPERYRRAIASYNQILDTPSAAVPLKLQSEFKIGRTLERMEQIDDAFERYMNVVYRHLMEIQRGNQGAPDWFTRAAFGAAQIAESRQEWRRAINIYQRIMDANVPQAPEAQKRIREIRLEHWILF